MAIYRSVHLSFWTDPKVDDDFTPEDKYFYLYLLTNPHTNICGCYEISMKQMCRETGYNEDTIRRLLKRMESEHGVVKYGKTNKEILILNWGKYNWSNPSVKKGVLADVSHIKTKNFRDYVMDRLGTACTHSIETSVTVTDSVYEDVTVFEEEKKEDKGSGEKKKKGKDAFSEFAGEDSDLLKALRDFEKMRKDIGRPMTERAKQMLVNKLCTFDSADWIAILEQSIFHCWQGIFQLKERPSDSPATNNVFLNALESEEMNE